MALNAARKKEAVKMKWIALALYARLLGVGEAVTGEETGPTGASGVVPGGSVGIRVGRVGSNRETTNSAPSDDPIKSAVTWILYTWPSMLSNRTVAAEGCRWQTRPKSPALPVTHSSSPHSPEKTWIVVAGPSCVPHVVTVKVRPLPTTEYQTSRSKAAKAHVKASAVEFTVVPGRAALLGCNSIAVVHLSFSGDVCAAKRNHQEQ